jgi:hypothetical protein
MRGTLAHRGPCQQVQRMQDSGFPVEEATRELAERGSAGRTRTHIE